MGESGKIFERGRSFLTSRSPVIDSGFNVANGSVAVVGEDDEFAAKKRDKLRSSCPNRGARINFDAQGYCWYITFDIVT